MNLEEAKKQLELVRLCSGANRKTYTSHRNEVLNCDFAALNKNIRINTVKLKDGIQLALERLENSSSEDGVNE